LITVGAELGALLQISRGSRVSAESFPISCWTSDLTMPAFPNGFTQPHSFSYADSSQLSSPVPVCSSRHRHTQPVTSATDTPRLWKTSPRKHPHGRQPESPSQI